LNADAPYRTALAVVTGTLVACAGCDREAERAAEEAALEPRPPVQTGSLSQAMGAGERAAPRLPTTQERFLLAVREGRRADAERFLREGAEVGDQEAVLVAAVRGKAPRDLLEWLLGEGAPVDAPDGSGRTPLSWASGRGETDEVELLLARGASTETRDRLGRTPLHYAVFGGSVPVIRRLLEAGADVNSQDQMGSTPLMYACAKNQPGVIALLKESGADVAAKDNLGRTAAERAHGEDNPCRGKTSSP